MAQRNVLGGDLEECGTDPMTGFFRDGCCNWSEQNVGYHTICAVVTAEFLEHQRGIGNDLVDRWLLDLYKRCAGIGKRVILFIESGRQIHQ